MAAIFNKHKIINDPVYGFISISDGLIFDLIEHPWFQRLRRIKQLGLTQLVYPGALHTRFHHALGAMHLMQQAVETLILKGVPISKEETKGAMLAILLHDIGHGPYSHSLENSIIHQTTHEDLTSIFFDRLNRETGGALKTAIDIFSNKHPKLFLHQMVAGQLDMDRLDYLARDSFFTGVSEGVISTDRIIKMLNVHNNELALEAKGIYSIEKFIIARRLMYWQVYFHKTVVAAEQMLIKILCRARQLASQQHTLFATPAFRDFLDNSFSRTDFEQNPSLLDQFAELDDTDILASIKVWSKHPDRTLSLLCSGLINRKLPAVEIRNQPISAEELSRLNEETTKLLKIPLEEAHYFVYSGIISNNAYDARNDTLKILHKNGEVVEISEFSEQLSISVLSNMVSKYFLCRPKAIASFVQG